MKGKIKVNPRRFQTVIEYIDGKYGNGEDRLVCVDICKSSKQQKYAYDNLGKEVEFEIELSKTQDYQYAIIKIKKK